MKVTFVGHAGLFVETRHGSILCDPWFNPAYFASWFPFPDNAGVDPATICRPTYLYLSHVHRDHFDPVFLLEHVAKDAAVILPDHPMPQVERELRRLGFTTFVQTRNGEPLDLDGLRVMTLSLISPTDGPLGDSGLAVDDGEVRIFDQNDSRPINFDALTAFGPFDAHFLQFSGAIWYPMVYRLPEAKRRALGRQKRRNQMSRALRYVEQIGARFVVPHAGPQCFLDDDLFHLNDFDREPVSIFPDQPAFLELLLASGHAGGRLMIPGSVATLTPVACDVAHPLPEAEVDAIFADKRAYLESYRARRRSDIAAERSRWARDGVEILPALREWFEPVLQLADRTCAGVNGRVLLDFGETKEGVVVDFRRRRVRKWHGERWDYRFRLDPALVATLIRSHEVDWVNSLFLSCRFEAERAGSYNEYVYSFFKCLSPERIAYAEGFYAEQSEEREFWECDGYRIQRHCPHLKADLTRFGQVEDGILTCTMHGWKFELATGRCVTSADNYLLAAPILPDEKRDLGGAACDLESAVTVKSASGAVEGSAAVI